MAIACRAMSLLLLWLALCQAVSGQATPTAQIQAAFAELTTLSTNLQTTALSINLINAPLNGQQIPQGLSGIATRVIQTSTMLQAMGTQLNDADAQLVVQSLTTFVQTHQALLNVVIAKHGLVTLTPFFDSIRLALVSLQQSVDNLAVDLKAVIPTQQAVVNEQLFAVGVTLQQAISTYGQPV